ncbi:MAG: phospholipase D-like domain-containing protein [Pseudobdellovibrio sp.]
MNSKVILTALFGLLQLAQFETAYAQVVADKPLNSFLKSSYGESTLGQLTNNAPETFNKVTLLDMGRNSLPVRRKLIEEAKSFIFITAPYWDNDPIGRGILDQIQKKKSEVPGFEFHAIMGWTTPLLSKQGGKITRRIEGDDLLFWNAPWWQRNFSYSFGGHEVHDKLFIVDGTKLIMGGMNMTRDYLEGGSKDYGWHDTDILVEGPAAQVATDIHLKIFTLGKYLASDASFPVFNSKENHQLTDESEIKSLSSYFYQNKEDHDFRTMAIEGQELSPGDYLIPPSNMQVMHRVHIPILDKLSSPKYHPQLPACDDCTTSVRLIYDNPLIDRNIYSKDNEHYSKTRNTLKFLLANAKESAWFFMPYFTSDEEYLNILTEAAKHLDIRIIGNSLATNDVGANEYKKGEQFYARLRAAGIKIYEFQGNGSLLSLSNQNNCLIADTDWPGKTLHTKMALLDSSVTLIGSNNMNLRSFNKNNEVMALINDAGFAQNAKKIFDRQFDSLVNPKQVDCTDKTTGAVIQLTRPATVMEMK